MRASAAPRCLSSGRRGHSARLVLRSQLVVDGGHLGFNCTFERSSAAGGALLVRKGRFAPQHARLQRQPRWRGARFRGNATFDARDFVDNLATSALGGGALHVAGGGVTLAQRTHLHDNHAGTEGESAPVGRRWPSTCFPRRSATGSTRAARIDFARGGRRIRRVPARAARGSTVTKATASRSTRSTRPPAGHARQRPSWVSAIEPLGGLACTAAPPVGWQPDWPEP